MLRKNDFAKLLWLLDDLDKNYVSKLTALNRNQRREAEHLLSQVISEAKYIRQHHD